MGYDLAMIRRPGIAAVAASAGLLLLAGCSLPLPTSAPPSATPSDPAAAYRAKANRGEGPQVREISVREGRRLAAEWCADVAMDNYSRAMANLNEQVSQLDAMNIALFAVDAACPEFDPTSTPKSSGAAG